MRDLPCNTRRYRDMALWIKATLQRRPLEKSNAVICNGQDQDDATRLRSVAASLMRAIWIPSKMRPTQKCPAGDAVVGHRKQK